MRIMTFVKIVQIGQILAGLLIKKKSYADLVEKVLYEEQQKRVNNW